jgi:hypothetical protein
MTIEVFESVWDALEDTPTEAVNIRLRSTSSTLTPRPSRKLLPACSTRRRKRGSFSS